MVRRMHYSRDEMREFSEQKGDVTHPPGQTAAPAGDVSERRNHANDEVPPRAPRDDKYGRYDLSWDGVSGGCATDEGY